MHLKLRDAQGSQIRRFKMLRVVIDWMKRSPSEKPEGEHRNEVIGTL